MTLSDAQIDRYSRQIVLPQIGGTGQQRLLESSVALAGDTALAQQAALYLAGAGVGSLLLHGGARHLRAALVDLNPDIRVVEPGDIFGNAAVDLQVACDVSIADVDRANASGTALVVGQAGSDGGELVAGSNGRPCASCAVRAWPRRHVTPGETSSIGAGVVGALLSLAVLTHLLGLADLSARDGWLQFDPMRSTLAEHAIVRSAHCPACRG